MKTKLRKDEVLAPGFGMNELRTVLKRHRAKSLMLVGHEPDFTNVISKLTGASLKLSKAGVALLDVDPVGPPNSSRDGATISSRPVVKSRATSIVGPFRLSE